MNRKITRKITPFILFFYVVFLCQSFVGSIPANAVTPTQVIFTGDGQAHLNAPAGQPQSEITIDDGTGNVLQVDDSHDDGSCYLQLDTAANYTTWGMQTPPGMSGNYFQSIDNVNSIMFSVQGGKTFDFNSIDLWEAYAGAYVFQADNDPAKEVTINFNANEYKNINLSSNPKFKNVSSVTLREITGNLSYFTFDNIDLNIPGTILSNDATLKSTTAIKGVTVTNFGTPAATIAGATAGSVTLTAAQAADTTNAGSYITSFIPNDANAAVTRIVKYANGASTANFATDTAYNGTAAIANGDFFVVEVAAQDGTINYYNIKAVVQAPPAPAPTVTSLRDTIGPLAGGSTEIIHGTNLTGATAVYFGSTPAVINSVNAANGWISVTVPASATVGTVHVTVVTPNGTSATSAADQYNYGPDVSGSNALSPQSGPLSGGTVVTIKGTGFTGASGVDFGGVSAQSFHVDSDTQITATAPAGSAVGFVGVHVTVSSITSLDSEYNGFQYIGTGLSVTSLSPAVGVTGGGTTVIITGTGFTGATVVKFGNAAATSFHVDSDTQITATAPAGAVGTVDITVTTPDGTSAVRAADQYTYAVAQSADNENNRVSLSATSVGAGKPVTITATGDKQSITTGTLIGDQRYIPTKWESGEGLAFTDTFAVPTRNASSTSTYTPVTPSAPGDYIITVTFQLQSWDGAKWNDVSTDIEEINLTVTVPDRIVTYDINGGTGIMPVDTTIYHPGDIVTVLDGSGGLASKSGYIPAGWNTKADGTGTYYFPTVNGHKTFTMGNTDVILYLVWGKLADPNQNSISLSANSVTVGSLVTITAIGDRQASTGVIAFDQRYIPVSWASTETGKSGTFSLNSGSYTSDYTTAVVGSYTITVTYKMQMWLPDLDTMIFDWYDFGSTNTKTVTLTVNTRYVPPTPPPTPPAPTTVQGDVIKENGEKVKGIPAQVTTDTNGTKTVEIKSQDAVLFKQADGTNSAISDLSKLSFSAPETTGAGANSPSVTLNSDGTIKVNNLANGSETKFNVTMDLGKGQKLIIGKMDVKVSQSGDVSLTSTLIDPYGIITDAATGNTISGVNVTLYYANTARNIANGKTPDTMVNLPQINGFKPNNNLDPQLSDVNGAYGWMVFPTSDYYIVATKDGYNKYTSPTISVEQEIVKFDFKMNKISKPVITLKGDQEVTINQNDSYSDAGATAIDGYGIDITNKIVTGNPVDTTKVGDYTVNYNVTDAYGNTANTVTREVHVAEVAVKKAEIIRIAGQDRIDTALEIAKTTFKGNVSNIILATAGNYPDALTGSVLTYKLDAPIILVGKSASDQQKVLDYVKSNMDSNGNIYVLGGTGAVGKDLETKLNNDGFTNITRIGGKDRYETSVKIAEKLEVATGTPIVLAYGENYPDALSISSAASINQYPILLVGKHGITNDVKQVIVKIKPSKIYIIGLEGVISKGTENQVSQITSLEKANIIRIGGANRFETSLEIAKYFKLSGDINCIATGNNFPDALAGSIYAAKNNAPIILTNNSLSDDQTNYMKNENLSGAAIFGGEGAVNKAIEQQLTQILIP